MTANISVPEDTTATIVFDPDDGNSIEINGTVYKGPAGSMSAYNHATSGNNYKRSHESIHYNNSNNFNSWQSNANRTQKWRLNAGNYNYYTKTGFGQAINGMGINDSSTEYCWHGRPGVGHFIPGASYSSDLLQLPNVSTDQVNWNHSNCLRDITNDDLAHCYETPNLSYTKGAVVLINKNKGVRHA